MGINLRPEFSALPSGIERIDRLLDDPVFFEPLVPFFSPTIGRPSIPTESYVRLKFLPTRHRLGFESLCGDVTYSLTWSGSVASGSRRWIDATQTLRVGGHSECKENVCPPPSVRTIKSYLDRIRGKTGQRRRADLTRLA